jgi:uncharacterized protein YaaN involved in tellurite resistance
VTSPKRETGQPLGPDPAGRSPSIDGLGSSTEIEVAPDVAARIESTAAEFVETLARAPVGSNQFGRAIAAIERLGEREVRATTEIAARFSDRPVRAVEGVLAERAPLARDLRQLRQLAETLEERMTNHPTSAQDLADEVERAEGRVRALVDALDADRGVLETDNAYLAQQERALWIEIQTLRRYVLLAGRLDELVEDKVEALAPGESGAHPLRVQALYSVRQRRRDLLLQLALATQGYAALRLIEQDNLEVIWSIRAAVTTTVTAMRTAILATHAMADRSESAELRSSALLASWGEMLTALDEVESRRRKTLEEVERRGR